MPNSSRRKQSKPQHVLNEEEEEGNKAGKNTDTSNTTTTGSLPTQESQYGSNVTGHISWENGNTGKHSIFTVKAPVDDDMDLSESEGHESLDQNNIEESLPHDLSMKSKTTVETAENIEDMQEQDDETDMDGLASMNTPPSEQLVERFCVYCNEVRASPAEHTQDSPYCQGCNKLFMSKHSLHHHEFMEQGAGSPNSNIAQQDLLLRKRRLDKAQPRRDGNQSYTLEPSDIHNSHDSPTNLCVSPSTSEMASKRQRISETYHSGTSEMGLDLKMSRSNDVTLKTMSSDSCDSQDLMKACSICSKTFPKPSDLKRHMMCHTGEKPFRCEHCHKPFRAKSSMHYHLKATHGIDIELSPGLEERYLRMKARAQMNVASRGHLSNQSYPFKDNLDIDEIEDDTKSTDSVYFQGSGAGLGSDFKEPHSQGHYSQTGNENRGAMDLSMSEKNGHAEKNYSTSNNPDTQVLFTSNAPFRRSKISIQNETVVITRLDGFNVTNGENASLFKCYLCGRMFHSLSSMQCHLSLHFEKQIVSYECCFCNEVFQFKTQMRNHIQRKHNHQVNGRNRRKGGKNYDDTKDVSDNAPDTGNPSHKTKNNLYRCRYCRKGFISKISLNKHLKLHFWNRNCFCRICGKSFQHYTSLQLHISRFHWNTGRQTNKNMIQGKLNFFNTKRFKVDSHDGVRRPDNREPLDLIKSKTYQNDRSLSLLNAVTVVMPRSPQAENGDLSDTGFSHHSSENNWSESPTDMTVTEYDETGAEIKAAPKRSLMSFRRENSPRSKTSRKTTSAHLPPQNQSTSDNSLPLNYIKTENAHQDRNNNESLTQESMGRVTPDPKPPHIHESLLPGYALNATNHLLMAKALAAQQSLAQHFNSNSSSLIYSPNHLPPSLAAMSQMMSLPMSVQVPPSGMESRAGTSKSPSPASHSSSKSDTSPEDRDSKEPIRDSLVGYPRVQWGQHKSPDWTFNIYSSSETGHTDGRKVTSLSRTHSRLGIVHAPINRESMCKPTTLADGRTVYKCPFCSKEFVSFSDINRHMDFHEGKGKDIRPYKCQFCDYYARTNSQLKVHMMRHQGIREFCCKLCNYKGVTQSDLNRHMKSQIHMLKSRNACSYCGEGFVTPKNLEKHLDGNCIVKMQKLNGGLDIRLQESVA